MSNSTRLVNAINGDYMLKKAGLINKKQGLPSSVGLGSIFSTHMKGRGGRNTEKGVKDIQDRFNKFNPLNQVQSEEEGIDYYYIRKYDGFGIPVRGSNTGDDDKFGFSVAITDNWAIVGAYQEDSNADGSDQSDQLGSGAAYIFKKNSDDTWQEVAMLKASNAGSSDFFGYSVAITDNWAIVGAFTEDSDANGGINHLTSNSGAAYIFKNVDGTWGTLNGSVYNETYILKAGNAGGSDYFGYSVAITDNWAIVGAYLEDSGANGGDSVSNSGAAYIFKNVDGIWGTQNGSVYNQTQILKASNAGGSDNFGRAVAITDKWAIVGAAGEDSNADGSVHNGETNSGAAYIFKNNNGTWGTLNGSVYNEAQILKASNPSSSDYFGRSVAITDKWAIVGAYQEDSNADGSNQTGVGGSGAAYIFKNNSGTWGTLNGIVYNEAQILKASNPSAGDYFGISVAISDNWAIVGADFEDSNADSSNQTGASNSGAVYAFEKDSNNKWGTSNGTVYNETQKIKGNEVPITSRGQSGVEAGAEQFFGISVSINGNYLITGSNVNSLENSPSLFPNRVGGFSLIFNRSDNIEDCKWGNYKNFLITDASLSQIIYK